MNRPRSPFSTRTLIILAIVIFVGGMFSYAVSHRAAAAMAAPSARKAVPDFSLGTLNGTPWRLVDHKGKVVLVNLFATWCPPCRAEMPGLVETIGQYQSKGVDALAISLDESGAKVVAPFVTKYKMSFPVGFPGNSPSVADGVSSIPVTLLIDRSGRLAQTYVGMVNQTELRRDLDALLAETP